MDSFCSLLFLGIFLPAAAILYAVAPRRARPWLLLAESYLCFWLISGPLLAFLLASTLVTYCGGIVLDRMRTRCKEEVRARRSEHRVVKRLWRRRERIAIAVASLGSLGVLIALKYLPFLQEITEGLLGVIGIHPRFSPLAIGIPIGISFYTMQALSYLFDVYRGSMRADRNLLRFALYMGFFPQLMEGPIARYEQTSAQLAEGRRPTIEAAGEGCMRILWGAAKIMLVADRVNLFVKPVFAAPQDWSGTVIAVAAVLYTLQLYCDFSGTMDIVLGAGRLFGVNLPENFRQPFFSRTASEFWQRWHITLGSWLRDYVFYPVSLSAPVKRFSGFMRRRLGMRLGSTLSGGAALFCVWTINGLWHGAGWQYLFFGMYYFVIILAAGLCEPLFQRLRNRLGIDPQHSCWIVFQMLRTWCIVFTGELFFRAESLASGVFMFGRILTDFSPTQLIDGTLLAPGMDPYDFVLVALFVLILFGISLHRERASRKPGIHDAVSSENESGSVIALAESDGFYHRHRFPICLFCIAVLTVCIALFGAYGAPYIPLDPIYAQF